MRQIILDTETTGLSPEQGHRIIEIGCIEMMNRRITDNHFHQYINPERDIDAEAQKVHGISLESLADKPVFADIVESFVQYVDGAELIIHNAPFDIGFLDAELKRFKKQYKTMGDYCGVIDTLVMARHKHPGQHNNLDALCRRYSVDNSNRDLHGALLDAELLAKVYLVMTGGQVQLFGSDTEDTANTRQADRIKRLKKDRQSLPVITPNAKELSAHQAFIAQLKEQGACLWEE